MKHVQHGIALGAVVAVGEKYRVGHFASENGAVDFEVAQFGAGYCEHFGEFERHVGGGAGSAVGIYEWQSRACEIDELFAVDTVNELYGQLAAGDVLLLAVGSHEVCASGYAPVGYCPAVVHEPCLVGVALDFVCSCKGCDIDIGGIDSIDGACVVAVGVGNLEGILREAGQRYGLVGDRILYGGLLLAHSHLVTAGFGVVFAYYEFELAFVVDYELVGAFVGTVGEDAVDFIQSVLDCHVQRAFGAYIFIVFGAADEGEVLHKVYVGNAFGHRVCAGLQHPVAEVYLEIHFFALGVRQADV